MKRNLNVCVTGACGKIAYSLYNSLCTGYIFGEEIGLQLRLLDLPSKIDELKILREQLEDCCYANVSAFRIFDDTNEKQAFEEVDIVIFLGGMPRGPGMERNEVFQINAEIFSRQGRALDMYAKKSVLSLVVANPTNTNCMILANNAPSIPKQNFTALTRLDLNRFLGQTAKLFECKPSQIRDVILWGNHSRKQYCDITRISIDGLSPQFVAERIKNLDLGKVEKIMYERGGFILQKAGGNAYISSTKAIIDHLRDWFRGSPRTVSMGVVLSEQKYGIPAGLCYSMPTLCEGNGKHKVLDTLVLNEYEKKRVDQGREQLLKEKAYVAQFLLEQQ